MRSERTDIDSPFEFLGALVSALPDIPYNTDSGVWSKAILGLRDKYEGQYPELFREIYFRERPPLNPVSDEVSEFLLWMQIGGGARVTEPNLDELHFDHKVVAKLVVGPLLERHQMIFPVMVRELALVVRR